MFEGIEAAADDEGSGKGRFAASTGISIGICVVLGGVLTAVGTGVARHATTDQQDIQVTFQEPATPEPEVDEPPPPPVAPRPELRKRSSAPPSAPIELPQEALALGDEDEFRGAGGDAIEDITAPLVSDDAPPPPPPPPPAPAVESERDGGDRDPVFLPDDGVPPRALAGNAMPVYPEQARKQGIESVVVLRFIVTRDGWVTDIQVLDGAEPFVSAAVSAIKTWRFSPARVDGRAEDAWHRIRVPFQLET
jgi:protein TonB